MTWLQTYNGIAFDLRNPTEEMITIEDIAHALSNIGRFNGHARVFYSVAQHSVHVADLVSHEENALEGLLHDAHEAYVGDMISPLKWLMREDDHECAYPEIVRRIDRLIRQKFGLPRHLSEEVLHWDLRMLHTEKRDLLGHLQPVWSSYKWATDAQRFPPISTLQITPWYPQQAKEVFLDRFRLLSKRA
jgi:uncharacterized protein